MKRLVIIVLIGFVGCLVTHALAQTNDPNSISDPNNLSDPNSIKLPEGAKMPIQLKCATHGIIGKAFIVIETDDGAKVFCGKCAKTFVARVFEINLPKLEVVK